MELFYIMTENDKDLKEGLDVLVHMSDEEQKKERLIEIMKAKMFNPESPKSLVLSNSWGYGINSRPFIGGKPLTRRRSGGLFLHAVFGLREHPRRGHRTGSLLRAVDRVLKTEQLQVR